MIQLPTRIVIGQRAVAEQIRNYSEFCLTKRGEEKEDNEKEGERMLGHYLSIAHRPVFTDCKS